MRNNILRKLDRTCPRSHIGTPRHSPVRSDPMGIGTRSGPLGNPSGKRSFRPERYTSSCSCTDTTGCSRIPSDSADNLYYKSSPRIPRCTCRSPVRYTLHVCTRYCTLECTDLPADSSRTRCNTFSVFAPWLRSKFRSRSLFSPDMPSTEVAPQRTTFDIAPDRSPHEVPSQRVDTVPPPCTHWDHPADHQPPLRPLALRPLTSWPIVIIHLNLVS